MFTDDQINQAEQLFGITLSDGEWTLLKNPDALLTNLEQQARFILAMALQPSRCPSCGYILCQRSACTQPWDPGTSTPDDAYACPNCKNGLTWHLGLIGGAQWFSLTTTEPPPPARSQPGDDRDPVTVLFTNLDGASDSAQLGPGQEYVIRHTIPGGRAHRQSRMGFVGRGGGMLLFDARPAAGTTQLRDDQIRKVAEVGRDTAKRYVSKRIVARDAR